MSSNREYIRQMIDYIQERPGGHEEIFGLFRLTLCTFCFIFLNLLFPFFWLIVVTEVVNENLMVVNIPH
jgi:hypothetical protein